MGTASLEPHCREELKARTWWSCSSNSCKRRETRCVWVKGKVLAQRTVRPWHSGSTRAPCIIGLVQTVLVSLFCITAESQRDIKITCCWDKAQLANRSKFFGFQRKGKEVSPSKVNCKR
jgi:hypothetical protein